MEINASKYKRALVYFQKAIMLLEKASSVKEAPVKCLKKTKTVVKSKK